MSFIDEDEVNELKGKTKARMKEVQEKPRTFNYIEPNPDTLITMNKKFQLDAEKYQDFNKDLYPYSLNFYDFEVFMCDWCITIINPVEKTEHIIVNDSQALKKYYRAHKDEIWVGYNSHNYDTYILKAILCDMNPKKVNDQIIYQGIKGNQINPDFRQIKFLDFDITPKLQSLKQLEAFMGNNIKETEVSFDIQRQLTRKEILETIKYNIHDVEQTIEVFRRRKVEYDAQIDLINTFGLKIENVSLTQSQLTANILGCRKKEHDDEFDLQFVDTLRLNKYKYVYDWFQNECNRDYKNSFKTNVCGVPHQFGWGGLHGCPDEPLHIKGRIFHVDVTSYYPSIMIRYDFLTRNCKDKNKFKQIYDKRVELKKAGKKKEQAPYKIILNSTYGICKDKYSQAFDSRQANNICVNGQLMLLDLLEHLEGHIKLIQSNTDGLIVQINDTQEDYDNLIRICDHWQKRTGMGLGFDEIDEIWQGDVNNYVFRFTSGKLERKGAYVMELDELNNDLPIINKAIVDFLTKDIRVEDTINNCNDMIQFQKIIRISSNYKFGWHNGEFLNDKTFRVFASKDKNDSYIGKCKSEDSTIEKFANTPEHCFIINDDIHGIPLSIKLDKKWYINLTKERIEKKFGINMNDAMLF